MAVVSAIPARRSVTPLRVVAALVVLVIVGYGAAIAWLMARETAIVFKAGAPLSQSRPSFPYEQIGIPRADGGSQFAWKMPNPEARTWVLFLHGNAATIASRVNIARYGALRDMG